jgi:hypothetical protein
VAGAGGVEGAIGEARRGEREESRRMGLERPHGCLQLSLKLALPRQYQAG